MDKKNKDKFELLSEEQETQLQNMVNGMFDLAATLVDEYDDLDLSDLEALSGSITQIHESSPFLSEIFKGGSWKKVITNMENKSKKTNEDASE